MNRSETWQKHIFAIMLFVLTALSASIVSAEDNINPNASLEKIRNTSPFSKAMETADNLYYAGKIEEARQFYLLAKEIEGKTNNPNPKNLARAMADIGYCEYELGKYYSSIDWNKKSFDLFAQLKDSSEMSNQCCNIANAYFYLGKFEESIRYYKNSLHIDQQLGDSVNLAINLNNVGKVFHAWKQYDTAIDFYQQALQIAIAKKDSSAIAIRLSNLATTYAALKKFDSALEFYLQAFAIDSVLNNEQRLPGRLDQIGLTYQNRSEYALAREYFLKALSMLEKQRNPKTESIVLNNLARNYLLEGNISKSEQYFNQSLAISTQLNLSQTTLNNLFGLSEMHENSGNLRMSKEYFEKYTFMKDSIFDAGSRDILNEFQVLYETEKKDFEIKQLNSEKEIQTILIKKTRQQRLFFLILTISFLMVALLLYFMFNDRKKNARLLDAKNKELHILNSTKDKFISILAHDLKNPFSAFCNITSAVHENFDTMEKDDIKYYLDELNQSAIRVNEMLRNMLEWATIQLKPAYNSLDIINLHETTSNLANRLLHVAKSKNIIFNIQIPETLSAMGIQGALDTILNNVITNAIKFSPPNSKIDIIADESTRKVKIHITDYGIGIAPVDMKKLFRIDADTRSIGTSEAKGTGLGLILSKELAQKIKGDMAIESIFGQQTTVTIILQPAKLQHDENNQTN